MSCRHNTCCQSSCQFYTNLCYCSDDCAIGDQLDCFADCQPHCSSYSTIEARWRSESHQGPCLASSSTPGSAPASSKDPNSFCKFSNTSRKGKAARPESSHRPHHRCCSHGSSHTSTKKLTVRVQQSTGMAEHLVPHCIPGEKGEHCHRLVDHIKSSFWPRPNLQRHTEGIRHHLSRNRGHWLAKGLDPPGRNILCHPTSQVNPRHASKREALHSF